MQRQTKQKNKQTRYLPQAIQLEEGVNPRLIHATIGMISMAIVVFVAWAAFTNINEVARTPGEIIPEGFAQSVQHLEGGIIDNIYVKEGDSVTAGDVLFTLDGVGIREDLDRALAKQQALNMQEERLRAFIEGRSPDWNGYASSSIDIVSDQQSFYKSMIAARSEERAIITQQITQKKRNIAMLDASLKTAQNSLVIATDLYNRRARLNQKGYVSDVQFLESKQRLNDIKGEIDQINSRKSVALSEITEFQNRLKSLDAGYKDEAHEKLDLVLNEQVQTAEIVEKLQNRVARLDVKAPKSGLVKGISVNTKGAVVQPGQMLAEIVPQDERLVVQIRIPPRHIGHLKKGQAVQVKFSSYDFSRYGMVQGVLDQLSPTTFSGENGERYYQGRVILSQNYVGHDKRNVIVPGMTVMAGIITGDKTILDYLLKPVQASVKTAFSER